MEMDSLYNLLEEIRKRNLGDDYGKEIDPDELCEKCGENKYLMVSFEDGHPFPVARQCQCKRDETEREEAERERQRKERVIRELKVKGFDRADMQDWTFENDDQKHPKATALAKRYCNNFEHVKEKGTGLVFYGNVGSGKTYLAACIANELMSKGIPVLMTNFSQIINTISGSYDGKQAYIDSMSNFDVLIIDDLGAERYTEYAQEIVFSVIDTRLRLKKPLIVTTNLSIGELSNTKDITKERIYSRVLERCYPIEVSGEDRRKAEFEAHLRASKDILGGQT